MGGSDEGGDDDDMDDYGSQEDGDDDYGQQQPPMHIQQTPTSSFNQTNTAQRFANLRTPQ